MQTNPFSVRHKDFTAYFILSHHARTRMHERGMDYQKVRTAVNRVRHLLRNPAWRNAKVVIPEYLKGCALLVKFNGCQATVTSPFCAIQIWRCPLSRFSTGVPASANRHCVPFLV